MRVLLMLSSIVVAVTCNAAHQSIMSSRTSLLSPIIIGVKRATIGRQSTQQLSVPSTNIDITTHPSYVVTTRGGGAAPVCKSGRPCTKMLSKLYAIGGIATSSAWATMCYTTIRDNQPAGALMPSKF